MQRLSDLLIIKSQVLANRNNEIQPTIEKIIKSKVKTVKINPEKESILIVVIHPAQIHQIKIKFPEINALLKEKLGWREPQIKQSYFLDNKY